MHQEILRSVQGGNRPGERHGARKMRASGQNEFTVSHCNSLQARCSSD